MFNKLYWQFHFFFWQYNLTRKYYIKTGYVRIATTAKYTVLESESEVNMGLHIYILRYLNATECLQIFYDQYDVLNYFFFLDYAVCRSFF